MTRGLKRLLIQRDDLATVGGNEGAQGLLVNPPR